MGNLRTTQTVIEALTLPDNADVRTTQVVVEALVGPLEPFVRTTQVVVEVLITSRTSTSCAESWNFPAPNPFPVPSIGGPQYIRFVEIAPDWREFGASFTDGNPSHNTMLAAGVRRFEIDYDGLDQSQARQLDEHWESTRGGISFTFHNPRSGATITGVRYESYERSPHRRVWSQQRRVRLIKYTN